MPYNLPNFALLKQMNMSRIFITGASDGLGLMAAQTMIANGHHVVVHARNEKRAEEVLQLLPGAATVLTADLSNISETIRLAEKVNESGTFDAIIHNAGIGYREPVRKTTADGLPEVFAVNSLAPYLLTALINKPMRLIYLSSGLHTQGNPGMQDITWEKRRWNGFQAYADSKLHALILSQAVARLWPGVYSNAVEPGWVATKMGGPDATDNLLMAPETQVWLAVSNDPEAMVTGKYFYHQKPIGFNPSAESLAIQEQFLYACEKLTGIALHPKKQQQ
jgi:NAD(P)-dependent dehydrogenase (short-subunit alcohol dehydrogenase family)